MGSVWRITAASPAGTGAPAAGRCAAYPAHKRRQSHDEPPPGITRYWGPAVPSTPPRGARGRSGLSRSVHCWTLAGARPATVLIAKVPSVITRRYYHKSVNHCANDCANAIVRSCPVGCG